MKKIVLLSDGTGNSAAKLHKTNVWRLYSALDLRRDDQIAMYDDGVGSQKFLPLKLLGGAFGWGLKRNVIELYKFLCRNYEAQENEAESDRIYLFGFSRGAFTVRVLAGLIDRCGLYTDFESERDLHDTAHDNFAIYREKYRRCQLARLFPHIRNRPLIKNPSRLDTAVRPRIAFMGVWDTVDAYGMPVDELAELWDCFIYPVRFRDRRLSDSVLKACHALSIDDERHTYHPVLWDEAKESDPERIEQVWFPGVHRDVGGGYPNHDLSLVSLDWMISKVEARDGEKDDTGLVFLSCLRDRYLRRCDFNGVQHDSRAGLPRAFYRYRPRNIEELRRAATTGDEPGPPKLHGSAFDRIGKNIVPYAPTGLPAKYAVVSTREAAPTFETDEEKRERSSAMNFALDVIYWRRWLYRGFVATTLLLLFSPGLVTWEAGAPCTGRLACLLDPVCGFFERVLPDFLVPWIAALCQNPRLLVLLTALYVILILLNRLAVERTFDRAEKAWSVLKRLGESPPEWEPTLTSRLRAVSAGALGRAIRSTWWLLVVAIVVVAAIMAVDRTLLHIRDSMGWLCAASPNARPLTGREAIGFHTAQACLPTGAKLVAGTTYQFEVEILSDWTDGSLPAGPDGLDDAAPPKMLIATPFRRHWSRPWFALTGRIGRSGGETFAVGSGTCYTARSDGELFLYVNDGVTGFLPGRRWAFPYFWSSGPNQGHSTVRIAPVARSQCDRSDHCESCAA